jgi:hypothetical protein
LDESNLFGVLPVRAPLNDARKGTAGTQNSFKLQAGHDIGILTIAEFGPDISVDRLEPWCHHDCAHLQLEDLVAIIMIDRTCPAGIHALVAFGANPAFETALGRLNNVFFAERSFDFAEVALALVRVALGGFEAGSLRLDFQQLFFLLRSNFGFG